MHLRMCPVIGISLQLVVVFEEPTPSRSELSVLGNLRGGSSAIV